METERESTPICNTANDTEIDARENKQTSLQKILELIKKISENKTRAEIAIIYTNGSRDSLNDLFASLDDLFASLNKLIEILNNLSRENNIEDEAKKLCADIKNTLCVIIGNADYLSSRPNDTNDTNPSISELKRLTDQLKKFLLDILPKRVNSSREECHKAIQVLLQDMKENAA